MRIGRAAVLAILLTALIQPWADAASPRSGTLLRSNPAVTWSGGPFWLSEPNYVNATCVAGARDPLCDHYSLTVNLSDGARILVSVTTAAANPNDGIQPFDGNDYDFYVYSPEGVLLAYAANTQGNEKVIFTHRARFKGRPYEIRVHPWFVRPGSTYKGTAQALTLGY
jgi:hypothetical protein